MSDETDRPCAACECYGCDACNPDGACQCGDPDRRNSRAWLAERDAIAQLVAQDGFPRCLDCGGRIDAAAPPRARCRAIVLDRLADDHEHAAATARD